jgi:hypothetical protein
VDETIIDSLGWEVGRPFGYWSDFRDSWWHQIDVVGIDDKVPKGKYPKDKKSRQKPAAEAPAGLPASDLCHHGTAIS